MLNKDAVVLITKKVLRVGSSLIAAKWLLDKPSTNKPIVEYNDAISAILHCSMFVEDKAKAVGAIKTNLRSEIYQAVVDITSSSMFSEDKANLIIKLCNRNEESE